MVKGDKMKTRGYCRHCGEWNEETEDFICKGCYRLKNIIKEILMTEKDRIDFLNLQARVVIIEEKLEMLMEIPMVRMICENIKD